MRERDPACSAQPLHLAKITDTVEVAVRMLPLPNEREPVTDPPPQRRTVDPHQVARFATVYEPVSVIIVS